MNLELFWAGIEQESREHCRFFQGTEIIRTTSTITGRAGGRAFEARYNIEAGSDWHTRLCEITVVHKGQTLFVKLESEGNGHWRMDGKEMQIFSGCIDVDIPLTPFTNTLPIRRLNLEQGQSKVISVVYCDVLGEGVRRLNQKYTRTSEFEYHYQNVPNDFEATISVDENGFVVEYPGLFTRRNSV